MMEWIDQILSLLANDNGASIAYGGITTVITFILAAHLLYKRIKEYLHRSDFLRRYRIFLIVLFAAVLACSIPVGWHFTWRWLGIESESLRNLATFAGRTVPLALVVAFEVGDIIIESINARTRVKINGNEIGKKKKSKIRSIIKKVSSR